MGDVRKSKTQSKKPDNEAPRRRALGATQRTVHTLQERVKELNCLYSIAEVLQNPAASIEIQSSKILKEIVTAYQYPEVTAVRILLVGKELSTPSLKQTKWKQASPIMAGGNQVGTIEVYYLEERPESDEGPFMKEERNLLDAIAYQLGSFIERRQAVEAQQRLAAIVESSHDAIIGKTLDGIITSWNEGAEVNYGYTAAEVIGRPISMLAPLEFADEIEQFLEVVRDGGSIVNHESVRVTKYGRRINVLLTISPIRDASGRIVGASSIAQNITVIKKAEEKAKQAVAEWQTTFDSIADLVSIQSKDFKLVRVNKAYADAVGMKMEDIVGKPCYEVVHNTSSHIVNCPHQQTIETKKTVTQEVFEPRLGAYLEVSTSPIFDNDGEIIGSVHIAKNITERKVAEEELKKDKIRIDLAINASQIGIWELDLIKDASVRNLRHDHIFGYKEMIAEWGAKIFLEHIITADRPSVQSAFDRAMKTNRLYFECRILWPDKSIHWITATGKTVRDSAGKPQEMFGTVTDITERKKAEVALRERIKELDCLYGISAILEVPGISLDEILKRVAMIVPPSWQYSDITEACIVLEEQAFQTAHFRETSWMQASEIIVNGKTVGQIRVCYLEERQASDEGPFMIEERHLLDAIAERLGRIIERVWAEKALQQSEQKYRALFKDSMDAVVISTVDGKLLDFNDSLMSLTGYGGDELLGLNAVKLYANPSDREMFVRGIQKTGTVKEYAVKWVKKDRTEIDVVMTLSARRDAYGNILGYQGIVRDITERRRLEASLQRSEKRFRELADFLPQSIFEIDLEGYFTYANRYGLESTGYTLEDIQKRTPAIELFIPEQRDSVVKDMLNVLSGEKFDEHEYSILRKDGSTYPALVYTNAVMHHGKPVGIRSIVLDITERKKIEQIKTDFVSFISHQLRTPVAGLMAYIDNMLDGIIGDLNSKQVEYLKEMRDVCARGNQLIADLLNVSRLERGVISVDIQPIYLRDKVEIAVREYKTSIKEKGLALDINEVEKGVLVLADGDKLAEVLKNVLHNAYKFTKAGSINIEISSEGNLGIVKVKDTGIGMTEAVMKDLFKKERVFGGAIAAAGGAGLGLYIAKGFMKLQGGDITVESVFGEGSTFIISLPKK